jgi:hypothetical protein
MQISDIILAKIHEVINRKPKAKFNWHDSLYEKIQFISLDDKGDVGEEITYDILKENGCDVKYKRGVTGETIGWDIKSNGIKIEVKLATITIGSGGFQHENLEAQRNFDAILFIDVAPDEIFLTAVKKEDIIWRKLHRRINGVYKCDFTIKQIKDNNIPKFSAYKTGLVKTDEDFYDIYKYLEMPTKKKKAKK